MTAIEIIHVILAVLGTLGGLVAAVAVVAIAWGKLTARHADTLKRTEDNAEKLEAAVARLDYLGARLEGIAEAITRIGRLAEAVAQHEVRLRVVESKSNVIN